ncbi:hypothetical protein Taro_026409 [Colocasia esculenta]|uniref:Uncharacterized protein n=1 Tax=Colocasia esculenta TaxID=4460 RepID=A0A843VNH6_COLES|nr:hypothetical protein [Colocasia esculenta]
MLHHHKVFKSVGPHSTTSATLRSTRLCSTTLKPQVGWTMLHHLGNTQVDWTMFHHLEALNSIGLCSTSSVALKSTEPRSTNSTTLWSVRLCSTTSVTPSQLDHTPP